MRPILLIALLLLVATPILALTPFERAIVEQSGKVGSAVVHALQDESAVRVMIVFDVTTAELVSTTGRAAITDGADRLLSTLPEDSFVLRHRYQTVNALAGEVTGVGLLALIDDPTVRRIDLDEGGKGHLDEAVPLVNLDAVQALGYTGEGVTVAVLDTGIDSDHVDLADDLDGEECFCSDNGAGCCPDGSTQQSGAGSGEDDNGHGTNVIGIITSAGNVAPTGGAPDVEIVSVKVLDENNGFCCTSDVVAGLDWVLTNRPDVDLVNMSLGTFATFPGDCDSATAFTMALATAVDNLRQSGVLSFVSAGNEGSGTEMGAPACVANSIAVGAVYDDDIGSASFGAVCTDATTAADQVTCFSNSNTTTDVFAPGAAITSTGLGGGTSTFFGTSQASPLTAACAAALLQVAPRTSTDRLEAAVEASTTMVTDATNALSFPRVDCFEAYEELVIFIDGFESGNTTAWSSTVP